MADFDAVELATELTMAWLANPQTRAEAADVPAFLVSMHKAVSGLAQPVAPAVEDAPAYIAAVSARKSLASPDHIISMLDGKPYKTLKRHLATHSLTADQYRARYGLKPDYPMTAPTYSAARTAMAKSAGLGRKKGETLASARGADAPQKPTKAATGKSGKVTAADAKRAARAHLGGPE